MTLVEKVPSRVTKKRASVPGKEMKNISILDTFVDFVSHSMGYTMLLEVNPGFWGTVRGKLTSVDSSVSSGSVFEEIWVENRFSHVLASSSSLHRLIGDKFVSSCVLDHLKKAEGTKLKQELLAFLRRGEGSFKVGWRFNISGKQEAVLTKWSYLNISCGQCLFIVEVKRLNLQIKLAKELSLREKAERENVKMCQEISSAKRRIVKLDAEVAQLSKISKIPVSLSSSKSALIWKVKLDGEVLYVNDPGAENVLKYSTDDLVGLSYFDSLYADDVKIAQELLKRGGKSEIRRLNKFGRLIRLEVHSILIDEISKVLILELPILKF